MTTMHQQYLPIRQPFPAPLVPILFLLVSYRGIGDCWSWWCDRKDWARNADTWKWDISPIYFPSQPSFQISNSHEIKTCSFLIFSVHSPNRTSDSVTMAEVGIRKSVSSLSYRQLCKYLRLSNSSSRSYGTSIHTWSRSRNESFSGSSMLPCLVLVASGSS